jgi:hypothetical protein
VKLANTLLDIFPGISELVRLGGKNRVFTLEKIEGVPFEHRDVNIRFPFRAADGLIDGDFSESFAR